MPNVQRLEILPTFEKRMVVCTPFGLYVNGEDEGEMTPERLRMLVSKNKKFPRQVIVYVGGDHVFDPDERHPDGWITDLEFDETPKPGFPDGALIGNVKVHGEAATQVANDFFRGASIGTINGRNPDESPQGEVLQHVLITNCAFDKRVNIAAARKGGGLVASYFTNLRPGKEFKMLSRLRAVMEEKGMSAEDVAAAMEGEGARDASTINGIASGEIADPPAEVVAELARVLGVTQEELGGGTSDPDTPAELNDDDEKDEKIKATEALLRTKTREVAELRASNANLLDDARRFKKSPVLNQALAKVKSLERENRAGKIRRLVLKGVSEGRFNLSQVGEPSEGYDNASDEVVLAWFKASMFNNKVDRLEFALVTLERRHVEQKFRSGAPSGSEPVLTANDRAEIAKQGLDEKDVIAGMKARNVTEFKELTAKR